MKPYQSIKSYTLFAEAATSYGAYPTNIKRAASFTYPRSNLGIIGFHISTSIITAGASVIGSYLVANTDALLVVPNQEANILASHSIGASGALVTNAVVSMSDSFCFTGYGVSLPAGQSIGIYLSCDGFAGTSIFCSVCLHTIVIQ